MEEETQIERKRRLQREAQVRWRAKNPDKAKQQNDKFRKENPGYQTAWCKKNPDKARAIRSRIYAKPEHQEYLRKWRENNPEKVIAAQKRTDEKNPSRLRTSKWRAANIDRVREADAAYAIEWRAKNAERFRAVRKMWEQNNRELLLTYQAKRRVQTEGKLSKGLVDLLLEEQGWKCPYCLCELSKEKFSMDHYMPLALGGAHSDDNIQLTCARCNSRKRDKHPAKFLTSVIRGRYECPTPSCSKGASTGFEVLLPGTLIPP